MKIFIPGPLADTARNFIRRAGYGEHRGFEDQLSYTRRLQGTPYPHFHAYVEDRDGGMQINLHLDQKQASYEGTRAHTGEYEGPIIEREMIRIKSVVTEATEHPKPPEPAIGKIPPKTGGWWSKLFGSGFDDSGPPRP